MLYLQNVKILFNMGTAVQNLSSETLALIEAQARDRGISPDEYVRLLWPPDQELALGSDRDDDIEFEADMLAFAEGTESVPARSNSYTREDIYFDHD